MRAQSFAAMLLAGSLASGAALAGPSSAVFVGSDGSLAGNVVLALTVNGQTVDIGDTASGNYDQNGGQTVGNEVYIAGLAGSSDIGGDDLVHRDYFTFDVSSLGGKVTAATLMLYNYAAGLAPFSDEPLPPGYVSSAPSLPFALYEVDTSVAALLNSTDAPSIYAALGSGALLGSTTVSAADDGAFVDVTLDSRAIADINKGGTFELGGAAVPEPTTLSLFGLGAAGLAALRRRRSR